MKVLLVTTDARVEADVRSALMGEGVEIEQVATPQRAVAELLARQGQFAIVVADGDTAPTGGFSFSYEVKQRGDMGDDMPPVVLLIARDDDRWMAKWSRADATIRKPIDPFDLEQVVTAIVAGEEIPDRPRVHRAVAGFEAVLSASRVIGADVPPGDVPAAPAPLTAGP